MQMGEVGEMGAPSSLLTGLISHSGFVLGYTHERTT
jgi:hypothetical protein